LFCPLNSAVRTASTPANSSLGSGIDAGVYVLKKVAPAQNEGFVQWLQSCPEPDWFQNIPSESTNAL
jgi:hypothetical protein